MKIWKFKLDPVKRQVIKIPKKFEILDIQLQDHDYMMWALVDPESTVIDVEINIYGTGWDVPDTTFNEYISTVQDGAYVWHFFIKHNKL